MNRLNALRLLSILLAIVAAGIHLALSVADVIPGERTTGALFALMGTGYLLGAVGILLRKPALYWLVMFYTLGLILAYAVSRDTLPVEPIGLLTKIDEAALIVTLWPLTRKQAILDTTVT